MAMSASSNAVAWCSSLGASRPSTYSVAGWCYFGSAAGTTTQKASMYVGNTAGYPNDAGDLGLQWDHDNASFRAAGVINTAAGNNYVAGSYGQTVGAWFHVAAVYDGANMRVYKDGTQISAPAAVVTAGQPSDWIHKVFGANGTATDAGGQWQAVTGTLAESGYWDIALTAADVASLAKGVSCRRVRPQNLRSHFPLINDARNPRRGFSSSGTLTVSPHPRIYP